MKPLKKELSKNVFDKTKYSKKNAFSLDVGKINWRSFYLSENPEIMYKNFCASLETVTKKHASQKTVFIRHDKPKLTLHQQWISKTTVKEFAETSNTNNKKVLKQENQNNLLDVFQNLKVQEKKAGIISTKSETVKKLRQKNQDSKTVLERFWPMELILPIFSTINFQR